MSDFIPPHIADDPARPDELPALPLLTDRVAVVTGGSSGIGAAIARELGRSGADVAVNYRSSEEEAHAVCEAIRGFGRRAIPVQADVSDPEAVEAMFDRVVAEFGGVDIAVANAGMQLDAAVADMTVGQWQKVLDVNLSGQFYTAQRAIKEYRKRGDGDGRLFRGSIISISSVHDRIPWAGHVNYAASKGGVMLLMQSLAQEVASERIRVNIVSPGAIRTPINREAWEGAAAYTDLQKLIPMNRIGEPSEVATTVAFLASDYSSYVTGATLYVDGGMCLYPGFEEGG